RGRFDKGAIRGSMSSDGGMLLPARLIPTDLTALKKNEQPSPSPGRSDFLDAAGAEKPFDALLKFVAAHGESPLAIEAYEALVVLSQSQGYTQEQFKKLGDDYQKAASLWGPKFDLKSLIDLGVLLSRTDTHPALALEYLNAADRKFTDETPENWKVLI